MKNLAEQIKDTKNYNKISGYAQLLEGKKRKDFIIEISNYNLLVAARATVNCAKDEELVTFLIEKAQKAGEKAKLMKNVDVVAILSLLIFRKYVLATDLIFIGNKNTEDFKNKNLTELKDSESETINAYVMSIFIGLSPTYHIALQFYNSLTILGIQANIACFSNLMAESPNYQTALKWYNQLQIENLTPNISVYNNLISKSPDYQSALQWYKQIQTENLTPIISIYHNMICAVRYLRDVQQCNEVAKKYYGKALQINTKFPDPVPYKYMIDFSLSYSEAYEYFLAMEKARFEADKDIWKALSEKAISGADKKKLQALMKVRNYITPTTQQPNLPKDILEKFNNFGKK